MPKAPKRPCDPNQLGKLRTVNAWKTKHVELSEALKTAKAEADDRVERALYRRAIGCSHEVEKPTRNLRRAGSKRHFAERTWK